LEYLPYSTIPPNIKIRVPSQTKPYAAHPGGVSPLTAGINHWFVAEMPIQKTGGKQMQICDLFHFVHYFKKKFITTTNHLNLQCSILHLH
jgi:hypothetical protein